MTVEANLAAKAGIRVQALEWLSHKAWMQINLGSRSLTQFTLNAPLLS